MRKSNINTANVFRTDEAATGVAPILVDANGNHKTYIINFQQQQRQNLYFLFLIYVKIEEREEVKKDEQKNKKIEYIIQSLFVFVFCFVLRYDYLSHKLNT